MQGWIKLHRQLMVSDVFKNEKLLKVWVYCLLKASHKEHEQMVGRQSVKVSPGQFVFGRKKAALELDMPESTVRDYVELLVKSKNIDIKTTNKYSLITVVKWACFQAEDEKSDSKHDSKRTAKGQQMDTYKNGNNGENEKEYIKTFEHLWNLYPNKKGKDGAGKKVKKLLQKYSREELERAVKRYASEVKGKDKQYIKHGDTFFNSGYVDYLDENYTEPKPTEGRIGVPPSESVLGPKEEEVYM